MDTLFKTVRWVEENKDMKWPAFDTDCARVVFKMADDLKTVLGFLQDKMVTGPARRTCIQAGGNCGVWPIKLAKHFERVYTAEPNALNFAALTANTEHLQNVVKMQVAFGYDRECIGTGLADHEQANCGAWFVEPGGIVPTIRIDDLNVPNVDLIYLDIEGFELNALRGAEATIRKWHPLIVIEDKGLSERYGTKQGECETWLSRCDYHPLKRVHRDVIFGHINDFARTD